MSHAGVSDGTKCGDSEYALTLIIGRVCKVGPLCQCSTALEKICPWGLKVSKAVTGAWLGHHDVALVSR